MATQKKVDSVKDLTDKVTRAKAIMVADYQGIPHKELEKVRKALKKVDGELTVTKNTLLKKALTENKKVLNDDLLHNATATLFAYADEVAPLKELMTFFKAQTKGKVRGGLLGTTEVTEKDAEKLSKLPTRDVLVAQLVGQLKAPLYGLHNALSWNMKKLVWTLEAVKSKKQ